MEFKTHQIFKWNWIPGDNFVTAFNEKNVPKDPKKGVPCKFTKIRTFEFNLNSEDGKKSWGLVTRNWTKGISVPLSPLSGRWGSGGGDIYKSYRLMNLTKMGQINLLYGSWLKSNIYKVFEKLNLASTRPLHQRMLTKKIMQSIRITSILPLKIIKWKRFSQLRWIYIKVIPIQKT